MTDETAGAETPVADGVAPEAPVENASEATTEGQSEADTGEASAPEPAGDNAQESADSAKVPDGVQQRINELTRKRHEAERRAEAAEKKLADAQNKDISDLEYEDQIAEKTLQRTRQDQAQTDREAAAELAHQAYLARVEAARTQFPDFDDVAHKNWEPTQAMFKAILDSDVGPLVAYHLGKNPAERHRIASLSPENQFREMGKLEVRLTAPKAAPKPPANPVRPVTGIASGGPLDPSKMSMAEYAAARRAGKI